jgi:hypothetical protein
MRWKRSWRWLVVAAGVAMLVAIPAIVGAVPADAPAVAPETLSHSIMASTTQTYSGYVESAGHLGLPDVPGADAALGLLGGTSKLRAWYASPTAWRVDLLSTTGETDTYGDATGTTTWDSLNRTVQRVDGSPPMRLPQAADVVPPSLGRRLVGAADPRELRPLAAARVAGRSYPGLRIVPASPATTIDHIDLWADPASGLVVRVVVTPKGSSATFEAQFLDLSRAAPNISTVTFTQPRTARRRGRFGGFAGDPLQALLRFSTYQLPSEIAGLAHGTPGPSAAGTYGSGFDIVGVLAVEPFLLDRAVPDAIATTKRPWGGDAQLVSTPLVNVMAFTARNVGYVVGGAVTVDELDRVAAAIAGGGGAS